MSQTSSAHRSALSLAFGGMIAMAVGIGIGRFVYTPILPPMMVGLGLSKSAAGLIASANFIGYLAGAVGAARATLPGPQRLWLPGALVLSAVTTAAMGLTGSMGGFLVLRFLGGVASALILILSSALVLEQLAKARRPGLASLHFAGVGIGIAGSAGLVAVQLALGATWGAMWMASGALSLLGAVAVTLLLSSGPSSSGPSSAGRLSGAGGPAAAPRAMQRGTWDRRLGRMTAAYGLFGFGYVITATFLVAIVRTTPAIRGLEPVIWVMVGLAAAPSVLFWTFVARRSGIPAAFAAAALTEAAGVLASVVWPSAVGISVAAALVGGTFMGLTALGLMRGRELAQGDPRPVMAAMTVAFGVGQIIGPVLAGVASDLLDGFTAPSLAAAGGLVMAAWLARGERREARAPAD